jgi:hypothetical protein
MTLPDSLRICLATGMPVCCSICSFTQATVHPAGHLQEEAISPACYTLQVLQTTICTHSRSKG